jgi:acyl carrier protein
MSDQVLQSDDILRRVLATFAFTVKEHTGRELPALNRFSALEDLAMGSLILIEAVAALELEFGIEIPEGEFATMHTIGDVVDTIVAHRGKTASR